MDAAGLEACAAPVVSRETGSDAEEERKTRKLRRISPPTRAEASKIAVEQGRVDSAPTLALKP
jgi:hypothetical protein